jgi:L-cystine transport system permease protein
MLVALKEALIYTPTTLGIAFASMLTGCILGGGIATIRVLKVKFWAEFFAYFITVLKGIPVVLLLLILQFLMIYGVDTLATQYSWLPSAKNFNKIWIAITALSLSASVSLSEAIRSSVLSINPGQYEAAYSIGLTKYQTVKRIVFPQMLPIMAPMMCNSFIRIIKNSSIVFMLPVTDLLNAALISATVNYLYLEAYVAAALIYWVICFSTEQFSYFLESKLSLFR